MLGGEIRKGNSGKSNSEEIRNRSLEKKFGRDNNGNDNSNNNSNSNGNTTTTTFVANAKLCFTWGSNPEVFILVGWQCEVSFLVLFPSAKLELFVGDQPVAECVHRLPLRSYIFFLGSLAQLKFILGAPCIDIPSPLFPMRNYMFRRIFNAK